MPWTQHAVTDKGACTKCYKNTMWEGRGVPVTMGAPKCGHLGDSAKNLPAALRTISTLEPLTLVSTSFISPGCRSSTAIASTVIMPLGAAAGGGGAFVVADGAAAAVEETANTAPPAQSDEKSY